MHKALTAIFAVKNFFMVYIMIVFMRKSCQAWVTDRIVPTLGSTIQNRKYLCLPSQCSQRLHQLTSNRCRNIGIRKNMFRDGMVFSFTNETVPLYPSRPRKNMSLSMSTTSNSNNVSERQNEINQRIYNVAKTVCNLSTNQISITWKPKRIVVTVHTDNAFLVATSDGNDGADDDDGIEIDLIDEDEFMDDEDESIDNDSDASITQEVAENIATNDDSDNDTQQLVRDTDKLMTVVATNNKDEADEVTATTNADNVDIALLASAINTALDDGEGGIGTQITQQYEIEVSTPGVTSDEITTPQMFKAYRGFDVIVHYYDPKKKTMKEYEGRLVEKNNEYVVVNQKGRMKHFKHENVLAVKLPKFKTEKGGR